MSEKNQLPTPQRLREARRKGQLAKSRLLTAAVVSAAGLFGTLAFANQTARHIATWSASLWSTPSTDVSLALRGAVGVLATAAAPTLACAFCAAAAIALVPAGFHLNVSHVSPQLSRVDPLSGFKRLFSASQLWEIAKGLLAAVVVSVVGLRAVDAHSNLLNTLPGSTGFEAFRAVTRALTPALVQAAIALTVLGAFDYWLARRRHLKQLMMSRDEVKREHKQHDGDPHHKAKRRQLHAQLAAGGPARGVAKATAVVVNPTHIAVALRYDEHECDAPYLVAKAREGDALSLKARAAALKIPVVKDIPLARALIHYDVGEQIPEELYQAAAAVLKVALEHQSKEQP